MKKIIIAIVLVFPAFSFAQTNSSPKERIDSIRGMGFTIPEFFSYQRTDSTAFMEMRNNDTSVCQMRVFPPFKASPPDSTSARTLWKQVVLSALTGADSTFRQQLGDTASNGWRMRIYAGNYKQAGKRSVVFLFWFTKGEEQRMAICNFSDRIFRQRVEKFSNGLKPR